MAFSGKDTGDEYDQEVAKQVKTRKETPLTMEQTMQLEGLATKVKRKRLGRRTPSQKMNFVRRGEPKVMGDPDNKFKPLDH